MHVNENLTFMNCKLSLANIPTKISKLEKLSKELNTNLFIKRDDQTGSELSGNKVRKLEYSLFEAKQRGANLLITCGGIQSNHCRATVSAAALLGMKSAVLLRISEKPDVEGNYFLDKLLGADVFFCNKEEYSNQRDQIMEKIANDYSAKGYVPYIVPEGASNGVGSLGYYYAMKEIVEQEKEMGVVFDTIVVATGSGGTAAGLNVANKILSLNKRVIGMCVCDDNEYFQKRIANMSNVCLDYLEKYGEISEQRRKTILFTPSEIEMEDKYVGIGYALSRAEELEFIKKVARLEGVVLDPVYTGKAMYGVWNELQNGGSLINSKNILFIHTGGLFGLFPVSKKFEW